MRLLAELDERQVRLGYVNAVVIAAGRQLDTRTALRRRFDQFVFRRIIDGTPEMDAFLLEIDDEGIQTLARQDQQREKHRKGANANRDMMAALRRESASGRFRFASHLWILQRCMPSHLGPLAPERSEVFLEHAKHLGLLAEAYALTETGHILNQLLSPETVALVEGRATPNPLFVGARLAVRGLYIWALLESDALLPFVLREFVSRKQNDPNLLAAAVDALIQHFARGARIDSARELKSLREYHARVSKGAAHGPRTAPKGARGDGLRAFMDRAAAVQPGFKIHRHHVRPRLEHLVDVGVLGRRAEAHAADTVYVADDVTHRAVAEWTELLDDPKRIHRFLDCRFFGALARIVGLRSPSPCSESEALLYFARAYALVGREIGFTPGRTVALAACLLALEDERVCEIETMFSLVYQCAKTALGEHLVFSGGSRFDREFLIRVKPELTTALHVRTAADSSAAERSR